MISSSKIWKWASMRSAVAASKRSALYSRSSRSPSGTSVAKRVKSNFEVVLVSFRGSENQLRCTQLRRGHILRANITWKRGCDWHRDQDE